MSNRIDVNATIVALWMAGKSREEIAKAVDLSPNTIGFRASRLRKAGVNLPMRRRGMIAIDVASLNAIVAKNGGAQMPAPSSKRQAAKAKAAKAKAPKTSKATPKRKR